MSSNGWLEAFWQWCQGKPTDSFLPQIFNSSSVSSLSKVSRFAARGGPQGSKNPRKSFGAELADPYANPDDSIRPAVDQALRIVCQGLLSNELESLQGSLHELENKREAAKGLAYLRDRIGVPRDLPLASARYMRAHLNWAIDILEK